MTPSAHTPSARQRQIPNALTLARLALTLVFIVVLSLYSFPDTHAWALPVALAVFVVAAVTDALDGYFARKWNAVSVFGRVVDPAADKILVLGAMVFLASPVFYDASLGRAVTGLEPWMVALILGREFLVTSIRAVLEGEGVSFAANWSGKLKMILQAVGVPLAMLVVWLAPAETLSAGGSARWGLDILFWALTGVTVASGLPYAVGLLRHMTEARSAREIRP